MDLATLQRGLFQLISAADSASEAEDPYIEAVAASEHLKVVRDIIFRWRIYDLERYCYLTATMLKRQGLFEDAVRAFIRQKDISPYIEELGASFLEGLSNHPNGLIASTAQFEHALIQVKRGDPKRHVVDWEYEPYAILNDLLNDLPPTAQSARGCYRTIISNDMPNLFRVISIDPLE